MPVKHPDPEALHAKVEAFLSGVDGLEAIKSTELTSRICSLIADALDATGAAAHASDAVRPPLPTEARILYSERSNEPRLADLGILDFLRAEYGPWLDGSLSRTALATLDISAYRAVDNWLRRTGQALPDDIKLPTQKELNDQIIASGVVSISEAARVARLIESRRRRGGS